MKKSLYNIEIKNDKNTILYNTLHSSIVELDNEYTTYYKDIINQNEKEVDDYKIELFNNLKYIVEDTFDEQEDFWDKNNKIQNNGGDTLFLTILTTTKCNMQCIYCFEQLSSKTPTLLIESEIINFIKEISTIKNYKNIIVTWFGGEPLLNLELIRRISNELISFSQDNKISYRANMITNGILLKKDIALELRENCLISNFQITIDGIKDIHNERRPYGSKDGFSIIIDNIKMVMDYINIVIRVNIDESNSADIEVLIKFLSTIEGLSDKVRIAFAKVVGETSNCLSEQRFEKIKLKLLELLYNYGFYKSIVDCIPKPKYSPCGALGKNSYVIDVEGDIYTCYELVGKKQYSIGNIKKFNFNNWFRTINDYGFSYNDKCKKCSKLPICNDKICPIRYKQNDDCAVSDSGLEKLVKFHMKVVNNAK